MPFRILLNPTWLWRVELIGLLGYTQLGAWQVEQNRLGHGSTHVQTQDCAHLNLL
jgi:hypothetical protein